MSPRIQPNFAGGIMGEGMYARADIVKYQIGVKDAANVTIRPAGGLAKRPGFRRVGVNTAALGRPVIIPFQFSADQTLQMEFWANRFFLYYFGEYVLDTAFAERTLAVEGGGAVTLVGAGSLLSDNDIIVFTGTNRALAGLPARVTSVAANSFTVDLPGGFPANIAGAKYRKAYRGSHPYPWAPLPHLRWAQDGNDLYIVHPDYPPHRLRRVEHDNWISEEVSFEPPLPAPDLTSQIIGLGPLPRDTLDPTFTTTAAHGLSVGDYVLLRSDTGDTSEWRNYFGNIFRVSTVVNSTAVKLRRHDGRTPRTPDTFPISGGYTGASLVKGGAVGHQYGETVENPNPELLRYRVAAVDSDETEGPATASTVNLNFDLSVRGNVAIPMWSPVPGAARYHVYRERGGSYGFIGVSTQNYFLDRNIAPDMSQGPQEPRAPFPPGDYPSVIAFHEQRLFLAAPRSDPQRVEASQSARPTNFAVSRPPRDSDAISFRPRYQQMNAIRALVSGTQLLMMTSGGEWAVTGGEGISLTPNNPFLRPISHWGSDAIPPILVGDVMLFAQRGGKVIRDFPLRASGEEARPTATTIMAPDLFSSPVKSWAFSQTPDSVLWVALEDGTLLSMTYIAEHDIFGWTRHEVGGGGKVRHLSAVLEADMDAVYAVIERNDGPGGAATRYTERLDRRGDDDAVAGLYLDGGFTVVFGTATDTIRVPWYAGQTVSAVIDGRVMHGLVVGADGMVSTGGIVGKTWHVGHPYRALIETLPVSFEGADNFSRMRAHEVGVYVSRTRGVRAGRTPDAMEEARGYTIDMADMSVKTEVYTIPIDGDWLRRATLFVDSPDPLPFTLLAVGPIWEPGG